MEALKIDLLYSDPVNRIATSAETVTGSSGDSGHSGHFRVIRVIKRLSSERRIVATARTKSFSSHRVVPESLAVP